MALTKLTASTAVIAGLGDQPNTDDGLTASQLKSKFDEAGTSIKTYINSTLTSELDTNFTNIDAIYAKKTDLSSVVVPTIQAQTLRTYTIIFGG